MGHKFPKFIEENYEIRQWKHACAILKTDFPKEWDEIVEILTQFRVRKNDILNPGGGLSTVSSRLNGAFKQKGWKEKAFKTKIVVDDKELETPTHKVDCVKDGVAAEIEWSNKDPFFDRDLNNFRLLFELRAISVGIIITKSDELSKTFQALGIWAKYGWTTTWMKKLIPRIEGGGGGGCPILVFGITKKLYVDDKI